MSIEVSCECGKRFTVGDQFAGKRGRCKACGRTVTVPSPESPGFEHELFVDPIPEAKVVIQTETPIDRGPAVPLYPSFSKPKRGVADQSCGYRSILIPSLLLLCCWQSEFPPAYT